MITGSPHAMSPGKKALLNVYYYGTAPLRRALARRWGQRGQAPLVVLFYHRVADDRVAPWTMSNRAFERQIDWLRRRYELISLAETQRRVERGWNERPAVCITFDDGYAENCDAALPLLIRRGIPCTYFVTSQNILAGTPFPHDVQRGWPLRPNASEQIRELAAAGVDIGVHSRTHADLGKPLGPEQLEDEIVTARDELTRLLGRPPRYFAFPYGQHANLSAAAFACARAAGYAGVCSAYGGYNFPHDDPFHLQRIAADAEMIRLKNWVVFNPYKARTTKRFCYGEQPLSAPGAELATVGEKTS